MIPEIKKEYYDSGNIMYKGFLLKDKHHKEDGPAYIYYYENGNIMNEYYYINGILHREDGPAFIRYYVNGDVKKEHYYLNGNELTESEFLIYQRKRKIKSIK